MRLPSIRLTDIGLGPETVRLYPTRYDQDVEGNPVKVPYGTGTELPAVVTRQPATMIEVNGTVESMTTYQVMVYSRADPGVTVGDPLTWQGRVLEAQGTASSAGIGCWVFGASEVDPDPAGGPGPYNLQSA